MSDAWRNIERTDARGHKYFPQVENQEECMQCMIKPHGTLFKLDGTTAPLPVPVTVETRLERFEKRYAKVNKKEGAPIEQRFCLKCNKPYPPTEPSQKNCPACGTKKHPYKGDPGYEEYKKSMNAYKAKRAGREPEHSPEPAAIVKQELHPLSSAMEDGRVLQMLIACGALSESLVEKAREFVREIAQQ